MRVGHKSANSIKTVSVADGVLARAPRIYRKRIGPEASGRRPRLQMLLHVFGPTRLKWVGEALPPWAGMPRANAVQDGRNRSEATKAQARRPTRNLPTVAIVVGGRCERRGKTHGEKLKDKGTEDGVVSPKGAAPSVVPDSLSFCESMGFFPVAISSSVAATTLDGTPPPRVGFVGCQPDKHVFGWGWWWRSGRRYGWIVGELPQ